MRHVILSALLSAALLLGIGCGGGGGVPDPETFDGPFAMTFGAQESAFSLGAPDVQVDCKPKPGLSEFEFTANAPLDAQDVGSIKLVIKDWDPEQTTYDIAYDPANSLDPHIVEVSFGTEYRYWFLNSHRVDLEEDFSSECHIEITSTDRGMSTDYDGLIYCTMLWAHFDSADHEMGHMFSVYPYLDLVAKFECSY